MNARQFAKDAGKTGLLGGIGGLVGGGVKMLVEPSVFKDQDKIRKFWWTVPLGEMVLGAVAGAFGKTALAGAGLAGAAVAHGLENANMAIAIKRNQPTQTSGFGDAGALYASPMPQLGEGVGALVSGPGMQTGALVDDAGSLVYGR